MIIFLGFLLFLLVTLFVGALVYPLPISDTGSVRYGTIPIMTFFLITVNALVFMFFQAFDLYQGINALDAGDPSGLTRLENYVATIWTYGYRARFMQEGISIGAFATFTSMFMHSDFWHILYNMIFLWTFGRRVEDACGPWRYLLFYLTAGMVANLGSELLNPSKVDLPGIGASGAIAGLMGAYLILFPGAMVTCFWGIGIILRFPVALALKLFSVRFANIPLWRWTIRLPAWMLLIYYLVKDLLPSLEVMRQGQDLGGVNNLAHLTGFLAALVIFLFVRKGVVTRYFAGRSI